MQQTASACSPLYMPQASADLLSLAEQFDIFLLDAYGVFNFGKKELSAPALNVMRQLIERGKRIGIISNSTGLAAESMTQYHHKGLVADKHYSDLLTSGQFAAECMATCTLPQPIRGRKYYVLGSANFKQPNRLVPALFDHSDYVRVDHFHEADFVYCGIPEIDGVPQLTPAKFIPYLQDIKRFDLPLMCVNPDMVALESGQFFIKQGWVAATYEQMGGKVVYFGKPDAAIFARALKGLGAEHVDRSRILMVGDTLRTDILGAHNAGIAGCLTLHDGVTANELKAHGRSPTLSVIADEAKALGIQTLRFVIPHIAGVCR